MTLLQTLQSMGHSHDEALALISSAKRALDEYLHEGDDESAYNICDEFFGLEPDFLPELISLPHFAI